MANRQSSATQSVAQAAAQAAAQRQSMWNVLKGAGYNIDDVYSHSTDDKGHYERVRVKLSPALEAMLAEIVTHDPRYRTIEDVIRDALVHRVHYLRTLAPAIPPMVTHEMMTSRLNKEQLNIEMWENVIRALKTTCEAYLQAGALEELGNLLTQYDQDFHEWQLPILLEREARNTLDEYHDKLKRSRRRDY